MSLQDFMSPNEIIKYSTAGFVSHAGRDFKLHITNEKLILHNLRGLILKKDDIIAHRLEEISTMGYREKGIIGKKGILEIDTMDKKMLLEGNPASMKALWQELQKYVRI